MKDIESLGAADEMKATSRQKESAGAERLGQIRSVLGAPDFEVPGISIYAMDLIQAMSRLPEGLVDLRAFLRGRWKGIRPVLWAAALAQEELQEALHCGFFSLELEQAHDAE